MIKKIFIANTFIGKVIRLPLKLVPPKSILPILSGQIKNKKWIVGSGLYSFWIGNFEAVKQKLFSEYVTSGSIVFDIGANVGFYTLLASELAGPKGQVFSFEPYPRNIKYLKEHININDISNVIVIESAISDVDGYSFFDKGPNSAMGRLDPKGDLKVKTNSLDQLIMNNVIPYPDFLKIDIEGAEMLALKGGYDLLIKKHPFIFLATHGPEVHKECCEFLEKCGYLIKPIDGSELNTSKEVIAYYDVKPFKR